MLKELFRSKIAEEVLLYLYHYGEIYPSGIARDYNKAVSPYQNQLTRFEDAGLLISKLVGKTRVYIFNKKNPLVIPFFKMIKMVYDSIPIEDKEKIFPKRRKPRRKHKPIIGR
jgi:hypothetical protein